MLGIEDGQSRRNSVVEYTQRAENLVWENVSNGRQGALKAALELFGPGDVISSDLIEKALISKNAEALEIMEQAGATADIEVIPII